MRIFYLQYNETEATVRKKILEESGHEVIAHWSTGAAKFRDELADVVIISLEQLPSHGRTMAEWFWEAKERQHIPIIFVGGFPEKVAVTKKQFPKAKFCKIEKLKEVISKI
ncbi:MAG: hypothetical protein ACRECJ_02630 [Limisphaerales bacterium]